MEHSKEFYESVIRVIDYLNPYSKEVWDVMPGKGAELAGDYWPEIGRMFKEDLHLGWFDWGRFHINKRERLASLKKECEHIIARIEKAEADRELANREKIENITYGRKAYELAEKTSKWTKGSIIFTSLVALGQLIQWIILIIQWLQGS